MVGGLDPALTAAERRAQSREIDAALAAWTARRSAGEAERVLQAAGVPAHRLASTEDAADDPQLAQRGHFALLPHELHGQTVVEGPRYRLSDTPGGPIRPAPQVGEHTVQVLKEILEYSDEQITSLAASGALS